MLAYNHKFKEKLAFQRAVEKTKHLQNNPYYARFIEILGERSGVKNRKIMSLTMTQLIEIFKVAAEI